MSDPPQLSTRIGEYLVAAARRHLTATLTGERLSGRADGDAAPSAPALLDPGSTFVTLTQAEELRGCMGTLYPVRPLIEDVRHNVLNAALRDPRFPPVTPGELTDIRIEVTVLSLPEPIAFGGEEEALAALRPHRDGVVFIFEHRRSTLLPQVWESLPSPRRFLACLKQKAGLPVDFWHPAIRLERYAARSFAEAEIVAPSRFP